MARQRGKFVVGLIGYPLGHSVSPALQQAAFDFLGLPITYEAWETPPERLAELIERAREPDCLGINVTIPHKQAVLSLLEASAGTAAADGTDEIDERARAIGAVNTIVNLAGAAALAGAPAGSSGGQLVGYNTDAEGFVTALREKGAYEPGGKRVVLLGAGGAARAVAFALGWAGATSLTVVNRTIERAEALAATVRQAMPEMPVDVLGSDDPTLADRLAATDLLVNSTSVGMHRSGQAGGTELPLPAEFLTPDLFVYDLVYNPAETPLLRAAREVGARTLNGLPMLVYQGATALRLWTSDLPAREPPVGLMMRRALDALAAFQLGG